MSDSLNPSSSSSRGINARDYIVSLGSSLVKSYGSKLANEAKSYAGQSLKSAFARANTSLYSKGSNQDSGSGSNGNSGNSGKSNGSKPKGGRRPNRSRKPNLGQGGSPVNKGVPQLSLSTGIKSGLVYNKFQNTQSGYTPLFVQCGSFFTNLVNDDDSSFSSLMNDELYYKYKNIVEDEVNYSMAKDFKQEDFFLYLSRLSRALQVYYMIDSILAYNEHFPNENVALMNLRNQIDSDISNGHIRLRERLKGVAKPPNLLLFIRHMYQNYSFNSNDSSSIIRLSYEDTLCTDEHDGIGLSAQVYSEIIQDLNKSSTISNIICKIRPSWKSELPPSSYEALFDPQFCTFWHNNNVCYQDYHDIKKNTHSNFSKDEDERLYYGVLDDEVDGLIYACYSCILLDENNSEKYVDEMGIWNTFNDFQNRQVINSSLLYYNHKSKIVPVLDLNIRVASKVHSAPYIVAEGDKFRWENLRTSYSGVKIPQFHCLALIRQSLTNSSLWLMDPD